MNTIQLAKQIRISSLKMCHDAKASHIGSCLSVADILAVLYNEILEGSDKLIISKGHCASAVYSAIYLSEQFWMPEINDKLISQCNLDAYSQNGGMLGGHVTFGVAGVEFSTGSLGHGLPVACGMAIANRKQRVFCLVGDGELNEGSCWEAIMFASAQKLSNLFLIVDYNGLQSFSETKDMLGSIGRLRIKFDAFDWATLIVSGHNIPRLSSAFKNMRNHHLNKPKCIICHTVKGKGVSYMESDLSWHYRYPNDEQIKQALEEVE